LCSQFPAKPIFPSISTAHAAPGSSALLHSNKGKGSMSTTNTTKRLDVYSRVTDKILADLEAGVRPWLKPWSIDNTAGWIVRPLRHNDIPYKGINVVMLWSVAVAKVYVRRDKCGITDDVIIVEVNGTNLDCD
jgi:hypothetical protein